MVRIDRKKKALIGVCWFGVLLWMGIIFYLSHQPAVESKALSQSVTQVIIETIERVEPAASLEVEILNRVVRKYAHFFSYLLLGVLVMGALIVTLEGALSKTASKAFLFCLLYAVSDEIHQVFVPGRGAQVTDVLIDGAGAAGGILLVWGGYHLFFRRHSLKNIEQKNEIGV